MMQIPQEKEVVDRLVAWGTAHPLIRAMILTSSRTRPDGPVDLLSDYDLILAVSDVGPFAFDDAWISEYGRPMVRWGEEARDARSDHVFSRCGLSELCEDRLQHLACETAGAHRRLRLPAGPTGRGLPGAA